MHECHETTCTRQTANFPFPTFSPPNCESFNPSLAVTYFVSVVEYYNLKDFYLSPMCSYRFIGVVRLTVSPRLHGSKSVHHRCSISLPPPHRLKAIDASMRQSILLPTLACLILSVAYRALGFSSGAPEESCDSFTVNHTHVGSPAARLECDATCLSFRQLRLIGSSADSFTYNCNETYERELSIATEVTV